MQRASHGQDGGSPLTSVLSGHFNLGAGMRRRSGIRPDWTAADGFLDPLKLPLGPILTQALREEDEQFRAACSVLAMIAGHGGREAGVFLIGLLTECRHQPERLITVVSALGSFPSQATVDALAGELRRVPSTNGTRRYLNVVLDALTRFPRELCEPRLVEMSEDPHFSPKWRQKFGAAVGSS
jgi:hypothetical protein